MDESKLMHLNRRQCLESGLRQIFASTMFSEDASRELQNAFPHLNLDKAVTNETLANVNDASIQDVLNNVDQWIARHNLGGVFSQLESVQDIHGVISDSELDPSELPEAIPDVNLPRRVHSHISIEVKNERIKSITQQIEQVKQQSDEVKQMIDSNVARIREMCRDLSR